MCFSAVSGIIGRSGWFAQVFALIAIVKWANDHNFRINRILGGILSTTLIAAIVMHLVEVTRWQVKVGKEVETVTEMYKKSSRGQVFFDATWDNQLPWWNLNKNRGVPDADDLYLLATFSDYYGKSGNPLVVLPSEVSNIDFSNTHINCNGYVNENTFTKFLSTISPNMNHDIIGISALNVFIEYFLGFEVKKVFNISLNFKVNF